MNYDEIIDPFKKAGIVPIKVFRSPEDIDNNDIILEEDITSFLTCLKAFNVPAVFIFSMIFDESEFIHETNIDGEEKDIDLTKLDQKLTPYRKYIGEPCFFELFAPIGARMVRAIINVDWWNKFYDLQDNVLKKMEEIEERRLQELEIEKTKEAMEQQKLVVTLLGKLRELTKDKNFCEFASKIKQTQRAIQAYAEELIPDLKNLDEKTLKSEISELTAKIRARKSIKNIT